MDYQTRCSCIICKHETTAQSFNRHFKKHEQISKVCVKCKTNHFKSGVFCSASCANSRPMLEEQKKKISDTLSGKPNLNKGKSNIKNKKRYIIVSQCVICNKWFPGKTKTCSTQCRHEAFTNAGKKSASVRKLRSADEIKLFDLCSTISNNITHNVQIFNGWDADIIMHDFKIAILWNGPWHYREMNIGKHSLVQVQNRDAIKIAEITNFGYTALVFEDRYYTPESAFEEVLKRTLDSHQD